MACLFPKTESSYTRRKYIGPPYFIAYDQCAIECQRNKMRRDFWEDIIEANGDAAARSRARPPLASPQLRSPWTPFRTGSQPPGGENENIAHTAADPKQLKCTGVTRSAVLCAKQNTLKMNKALSGPPSYSGAACKSVPPGGAHCRTVIVTIQLWDWGCG